MTQFTVSPWSAVAAPGCVTFCTDFVSVEADAAAGAAGAAAGAPAARAGAPAPVSRAAVSATAENARRRADVRDGRRCVRMDSPPCSSGGRHAAGLCPFLTVGADGNPVGKSEEVVAGGASWIWITPFGPLRGRK
ncbi:hypothetical protein KNE206_32290 [Kitasatospora sp. NE20-6]